MFQGDDDSAGSPSYDDFAAAGFTAPIIPVDMTVHDPDEERNRLRAEVEKMLAQSEESDDEDDITLSTSSDNAQKDSGGPICRLNSSAVLNLFAIRFRRFRRRAR